MNQCPHSFISVPEKLLIALYKKPQCSTCKPSKTLKKTQAHQSPLQKKPPTQYLLILLRNSEMCDSVLVQYIGCCGHVLSSGTEFIPCAYQGTEYCHVNYLEDNCDGLIECNPCFRERELREEEERKKNAMEF
jgi:hypothetical protein